jgi:hypothetical protein
MHAMSSATAAQAGIFAEWQPKYASAATHTLDSFVSAGLDRQSTLGANACLAGWMPGSSPGMTNVGVFRLGRCTS